MKAIVLIPLLSAAAFFSFPDSVAPAAHPIVNVGSADRAVNIVPDGSAARRCDDPPTFMDCATVSLPQQVPIGIQITAGPYPTYDQAKYAYVFLDEWFMDQAGEFVFRFTTCVDCPDHQSCSGTAVILDDTGAAMDYDVQGQPGAWNCVATVTGSWWVEFECSACPLQTPSPTGGSSAR